MPPNSGRSLQNWAFLPPRFQKPLAGWVLAIVGLGAVFEAMGRRLTASPLFATSVLAASILELSSDEQFHGLLEQTAAGQLSLALAIDEQHHYQPEVIQLELSEAAGQFRLNGHKTMVIDGHSADKLIVLAHAVQGLTLVLVDRKTSGLDCRRTQLIDSRNYAVVEFNDVKVAADALIGKPGEGWAIAEAALNRGIICLSAEMLGGTEEVFERTLEHLRTREQFGVKIGSFQALKHRTAHMYTEIERCKSVIYQALASIDHNAKNLSEQASLAKTLINDCYQLVTSEAVQMHGGMGVTDEMDIGLFLKRSRVCNQLLGDSHYHRDRYARLRGF